jgi:UDP-N-acetylmuramyl pentapeptide phosphotransferase/UDP-N-acetylglucosamine-1-phosphate transferase
MKYFFLFIFLITVVSVYFYTAKYYNIVDRPNIRSSHKKVTVRGGGIIFPIGAFFWFILSGYEYPKFFLGLALISIISFLDDVRHLSVYPRLFFQFLGLFFLFSEIGFGHLYWWIWIIVFIVAAATINAFNFMDGINGITAGYSLSVISGLWVINTYQHHFIDNDLIYFVAISLIIFSFFNLKKNATLFAGDVGSISIAFIIIFLIARLIQQTGNLLYVLFISVYGIDSLMTILTRIRNKENIFEAHRKHLYQIFANELKIPQVKISGAYSIVQILISMMIFVVLSKVSVSFIYWLIGTGTLFLLTLIWIYIRNKIDVDTINKRA